MGHSGQPGRDCQKRIVRTGHQKQGRTGLLGQGNQTRQPEVDNLEQGNPLMDWDIQNINRRLETLRRSRFYYNTNLFSAKRTVF
jgi:hypothetical protein